MGLSDMQRKRWSGGNSECRILLYDAIAKGGLDNRLGVCQLKRQQDPPKNKYESDTQIEQMIAMGDIPSDSDEEIASASEELWTSKKAHECGL